MKRFFSYVESKPLWVNLVAAVFIIAALGFLFFQSLSWFTNHGAYLKVPLLKGNNVNAAIKILEDKGFDVIIQDSVYYDSLPRYTVIRQVPDADATVKANRTVYLTVNRATPPNVNMPKLEGLSFRFALDILHRNHLQIADTIYRPDFMKGSILEQQYNASRIAAGTPIPWGAKITLIIGGGLEVESMLVPNFVGLTFSEAKSLAELKGLSLASVIPMSTVTDTASAFVYKQNPETYDLDNNRNKMQAGQTIDLWLSPNRLDTDSLKKKNLKDLYQ